MSNEPAADPVGRFPELRGAADALLAASAAWAMGFALVFTDAPSGWAYRWLAERVGWVAAPLVSAFSVLLLPIGAVMSLAGRRFLSAGVCLLALFLVKLAWSVGRLHSWHGRISSVETIFFLSCFWWWVVAWRQA